METFVHHAHKCTCLICNRIGLDLRVINNVCIFLTWNSLLLKSLVFILITGKKKTPFKWFALSIKPNLRSIGICTQYRWVHKLKYSCFYWFVKKWYRFFPKWYTGQSLLCSSGLVSVSFLFVTVWRHLVTEYVLWQITVK